MIRQPSPSNSSGTYRSATALPGSANNERAMSTSNHRLRPVVRSQRATTTNRRKPKLDKNNASFRDSIVFLKKATGQAVQLQACLRGFLAQQAFPARLTAHRLEQTRLVTLKFRDDAATVLQTTVRAFLGRRHYHHRQQQHHCAIIIQALGRGHVQQQRWSHCHKLTLRLVQIEREGLADLATIEEKRLRKRARLDQKLDKVHAEQEAFVKEHNETLDATVAVQLSLRDQLKRENRQLRHKMDHIVVVRKEVRSENRQLRNTMEVITTGTVQLNERIAQLEVSIGRQQRSMVRLEGMKVQLQAKASDIQDWTASEVNQTNIYRMLAAKLMQRIQDDDDDNNKKQLHNSQHEQLLGTLSSMIMDSPLAASS